MSRNTAAATFFFWNESDSRDSRELDRGADGHSDVAVGTQPRAIARDSAHFLCFDAELLAWK